jgi:hypothetical protein
MATTLYDRIIVQGTINEPGGKPEPQYALPSTVNWMRAIAMLSAPINWTAAGEKYLGETRRHIPDLEVNTVLEQLFLSLHHLSALEELALSSSPATVGRLGILAWYYGLSNAASAMTAAKCGSFQEDHAGTARLWDSEIAKPGLAMEPFSWRVSSLIEATFQQEVASYGVSSTAALQTRPTNLAQAKAAAAAYLSGSAKWHVWKITKDVRNSKEFKSLSVANFRTKDARQLRDTRLSSRAMGYLHQAVRYRGKANYREALFLAYGPLTGQALAGFVSDQSTVLRAFLIMARAYCSRKLGRTTWAEFVADVDANRAFSTSTSGIWG